MLKFIVIGLLLWSTNICAQLLDSIHLAPYYERKLDIEEPSDVFYEEESNTLLIVSDEGYLHRCNILGVPLQTVYYEAVDFEAVWADDNFVFVVDEANYTILIFKKQSLELHDVIEHDYRGPKNKGWESLSYSKEKKRFLLFSEKSPVQIFELSANLEKIKNVQELKQFDELAAMCHYKDKLWVLSEELQKIYRLNPKDYSIEKIWSFSIIGIEGLCFDKNNNLILVSDKLEKIYYFRLP